ncbi:MAG: HU family DNA-binding protein [Chloroflexi bacterium]|nr:HU family DNA-binding protein [Chloroflexota bacterium]
MTKSEKMTKSEFIAALAEKSGLEKKQASAALDALNDIVVAQLKTEGELILPGLLKLRAVHKPATPEKPGINPFTKQPITVKAKPASTAVRANPVKALKDAIK